MLGNQRLVRNLGEQLQDLEFKCSSKEVHQVRVETEFERL